MNNKSNKGEKMNIEKMKFDNDEIQVEYEEVGRNTSRGARDSLGGVAGMGPALEPDEVEIGYSLTKVELFGVDLTGEFDQDEAFDDEQIHEYVVSRFKEILTVIAEEGSPV